MKRSRVANLNLEVAKLWGGTEKLHSSYSTAVSFSSPETSDFFRALLGDDFWFTAVFSQDGNARYFLDGNRPPGYMLPWYSATRQ